MAQPWMAMAVAHDNDIVLGTKRFRNSDAAWLWATLEDQLSNDRFWS